MYLSEFINQLKLDAQAREDNGQLPATHKPFLISSHPHRCDRWTPVGLEHNSAWQQSVCVLFVCAPGHTVYMCVFCRELNWSWPSLWVCVCAVKWFIWIFPMLFVCLYGRTELMHIQWGTNCLELQFLMICHFVSSFGCGLCSASSYWCSNFFYVFFCYLFSCSCSLSVSTSFAANESPPCTGHPARSRRHSWGRCPPAFFADRSVELGTWPGRATWTWRPPFQVRILPSTEEPSPDSLP